MSETITLTRKEIREARKDAKDDPCEAFMDAGRYDWCPPDQSYALCRLCKRLTQFASQGDPEGEGEEEEDD